MDGEFPLMRAEVERLGLGPLVDAVRRRVSEETPFALEAAERVIVDAPPLTPEQTHFLLTYGLDAVVGALDQASFEFQRS